MPSNDNQVKCSATRRDGQPCQAPALPGHMLCWAHSPEMQAKRDKARRRGGQNRAALVRLKQATPARLVPVLDKLEQALQEVHAGELEPKTAQAMAALARALVATLTAGEMEQRLRDLEEAAQASQEGRRQWRA